MPVALSRRVLRVACCACALALWLPAAAQERVEPRSGLELRQRAEVGARYGLSSWPRGALRSGFPNEPFLPGWVAGALQAERGLLQRSFRHASAPEGAPVFVLETCVEDSAEGAHARLLDWLAGVQSAETMPSLATLGLAFGDVGFAGRAGAAPAALAWIAFVRGNVAVRVLACDPVREPALDLGGIAALVDQSARSAPELEAGRVPAKPRVERFAPAEAEVVAGSAVRLDLALVDPAAGEAHLEWIVGGPGQGYVERATDGSWRFHTTAPGSVTLILEVTGSLGTWTRHEARLEVRAH